MDKRTSEILAELESLGTAQNRKIYQRHGAGENLYGVSFANLEKLKKKIKTDHDLAIQLWNSKNIDAQTLATMIADPEQMSENLLDEWISDIQYYALIDVFVKNLASKTKFAQTKMEQWTQSEEEWIGSAGWQLLAHLAMDNKDLPESYFQRYLQIIQTNIHKSKNRTRHAMNSALIGIGMRGGSLENSAIEAAQKIGKVEVNHGQTSCKTPDAVTYIQKGISRRKKR